MNRVATLVVLLGIALVAGPGPADAARRAALVIGINKYEEVDDLEKAVGDARAMAVKLRTLGFEVTELFDADRRTFNRTVSTFAASLADGDTAFVHFSGHGVEIDGENYLLPADIPTPSSGQRDFVKSEAIGMAELIARVAEGGGRTRVFVIDACRNNPFERAGVRSIGGTRGLARVPVPAGTFVMYSAGHGQLALDRLGPDDTEQTSVFTRSLLGHIDVPGRSIVDVAQDVRREVQEMARTVGHTQRPAYYDELSARLILVELDGADQPDALTQDSSSSLSEAAQVWALTKDTTSIAVLEAFIAEFPDTPFARFATARVGELARQAEGMATDISPGVAAGRVVKWGAYPTVHPSVYEFPELRGPVPAVIDSYTVAYDDKIATHRFESSDGVVSLFRSTQGEQGSQTVSALGGLMWLGDADGSGPQFQMLSAEGDLFPMEMGNSMKIRYKFKSDHSKAIDAADDYIIYSYNIDVIGREDVEECPDEGYRLRLSYESSAYEGRRLVGDITKFGSINIYCPHYAIILRSYDESGRQLTSQVTNIETDDG